jgi:tetratricopeptide (TPR) repeat protein
MKLITALAFTVFSLLPSHACYNETHVNKNGKQTNRVEPMALFYNEPDKAEARKFLAGYDLAKIKEYDKDIQSDMAVNLGYLGRYDEALVILKRLQLAFPDDYNIAANLGTTYELTGKNDLALQFIKKGLALNPDSHDGSEWVHVKILEAKLKMAVEPGWLYKNRVLGTGVTFDSKESGILNDKAWHVEYQLRERVPFTPFPDPLLANVFDELGDLYATQQSVELAYIAYDFSLRYDSADHYGVKAKMEALKPVLKKNKIPIPSWKQHYYNQELSKLQAEITEEVINQLSDPEKLKKTTDAVQGMVDSFSGRDRRLEEEKRRKNLILAGITVLSGLGGILFFTLRKKRPAK